MRVLITGSSGQIGTNLALYLLEHGHDVFGVDKRLNPWTDRFRYILQDLTGNFHSFRGGIGGVDYPPVDVVAHLGANAKVHQLVSEPHRALENIQITYNVLEYCRQNQLPIIFSSSREVYGDIRRYITEETQADFSFTESTYSASKIAGEALIYSYARCYGLPYLVFRFSNVYGRYDNDIERMERVIPLFIRKIALGEPITVYGRDKVLDFTYIDDCIAGVYAGLQRLLSGRLRNQTINLACGKGNSLLRLVELISTALDRIPEVRIELSQVGEVTHYVADISLARALLDYKPQVPLEQGIPRAVEWTMNWWREHNQLPPGV